MSTLAEIERAADALPAEEQEILLLRLSQKLARRVEPVTSPVLPPEAPKERLQRIHALIEAEFSRVDAEGW